MPFPAGTADADAAFADRRKYSITIGTGKIGFARFGFLEVSDRLLILVGLSILRLDGCEQRGHAQRNADEKEGGFVQTHNRVLTIAHCYACVNYQLFWWSSGSNVPRTIF